MPSVSAAALLALTVAVGPLRPALAQENEAVLSAPQMFALAEAYQSEGRFADAEAVLTALMQDRDPELRTEARFRLAMMLADKLGRFRDAAVLLREILDEKPDAARVRVELARMHARLGNRAEAERELRAAQAIGLPEAVQQIVRFYAAALRSERPYGMNLELALAPDSNINRATRSETLGTIIGDFDLSDDARAQSGIGLSAQAQVWARQKVSETASLVGKASASGDFYGKNEFDDYAVSLEAGPEVRMGAGRIGLSALTSWRWFGGRPYAFSYGGNGSFQHPLGKRAQLRLDASVVHTDDRRNDLRDANRYALAAGIDRAFSARTGGGLRLTGQREVANDPGYSTASGGLSGYIFRELGQTTLVANGGYSHLEADKRLFLYPRRRVDNRLSAGLAATFRALRVGGFAPIVRVTYERNFSTVEIYDFRRLSADFGITAAF